MPTVCVAVCDCAYHPVWFVLCLLCCAVPTLCHATHFGLLCSLCAVFMLYSIPVCSMCVSVCVSGRRWWLVKVADRWRLRMEAW